MFFPLFHSSRRQRRSGFTLIELLVVIAIIAVLSTMLLPAASRMLENGKASACVSNLRQLAAGVALYCADNDGAFPDSRDYSMFSRGIWYPLLSGIQGGGWSTTVYLPHSGQFSKKGPYFCPSNKADTSTGTASWTTYAYNSNLAGNRQAGILQKKIALFRDSYGAAGKSTWYEDYGARWAPAWGDSDGLHSGCLNVAFVDGHVERVKVDPRPPSMGEGSDRVDLKAEWFWPVRPD